jgi:hypothetical protein
MDDFDRKVIRFDGEAVRPMQLVIGGTVPPEDIVWDDGRIERLGDALKSTSILVSEVRRFGKSSMLRLIESKPPTGWICVRTSVQDVGSAIGLTELTLQTLREHAGLRRKVGRVISQVAEWVSEAKIGGSKASISLKPEYKKNPRSALRKVLVRVNEQLKKTDQYLVIIWDEFPDAIGQIVNKEGESAAWDVLAFLRTLREDDSSQRIRWILAGSVGLHHVLKDVRQGRSLINDIQIIELEPLSFERSSWMAACLLLGIGREGGDCIESLASVSGGIPFILEMMVKYIRENKTELPKTQKEAGELLIEAAGNPTAGSNWAPLLKRVGDYYGDNAELAESILDAVARTPVEFNQIYDAVKPSSGTPLSERSLRQVIDLLLEDHYLRYDHAAELYSWRHPALRLIWQAKRRKSLNP